MFLFGSTFFKNIFLFVSFIFLILLFCNWVLLPLLIVCTFLSNAQSKTLKAVKLIHFLDFSNDFSVIFLRMQENVSKWYNSFHDLILIIFRSSALFYNPSSKFTFFFYHIIYLILLKYTICLLFVCSFVAIIINYITEIKL